MSGKSACKKLLLEECATICAEQNRQCRVEYPCTDTTPSMITCCDGMVMLNRIGNVLSQPTKVGEYTDDGFPAYTTTTVPGEEIELDVGCAPEDLDAYFAAELTPDKKKAFGTWRQLYTAVTRELGGMFARPGMRVVVLGFDKKQYVDGIKRITHHKRAGNRESQRAAQIAKDEAAGLTPTRGIPFSYESINDHALIPYPWNVTLHGQGQAAALIRYVSVNLRKFYKPPREDQLLIIDGHSMRPEDVTFDGEAELLLRTPLVIYPKTIWFDPNLANDIGEFDHTAFFYVRMFAMDKRTHSTYELDPENACSAQMHIRTNDTDTIIMGLVFLERLAQLDPRTAGLQVIMEIPRKMPVKTDMCINVRRMLTLLTEKYGSTLKFPGAYFAYGLYLKENDYDTQFMKGIGHATFMSALVNYSKAIGDLVHPRELKEPPPVEIDVTGDAANHDEPMICLEIVDSDEEDSKGKEEAESSNGGWMERKRKRDSDDDSEEEFIDVTDEPPAPPAKNRQVFTLAFKVDQSAVSRFVAACYYDALYYRTKEQKARREEQKREGKYDEVTAGLLGPELIENARKRRKMSGITQADLREKTKRHDYFVAITEELTLGFPRSIPFALAYDYGYSREEYRQLG